MTRRISHSSLMLVAAMATVCTVPLAEAREIKGELAYRERIALPDQAEMLIEVREAGNVIAESRSATGGAQVPLPFVLDADAGGGQMLTGALIVDGQVAWITAPMALPPEDTPVNLGALLLTRYASQGGFTSRLDCGGQQVTVGFAGADQAVLTVDGATYTLRQTIAASGARFSDGATPETVFWGKGDRATITLQGTDLPECIEMKDPVKLPFVARGNEPGWVLNVTAEGTTLSREDGTRVDVSAPLPQGQPTETGTRYVLSDDLAFVVEDGICRDSMTGLPYPASVLVEQSGDVLNGCGGDPAQLLQGDWTVTRIGEDDTPAGVEVTMTFDNGRISGKSGCNRFMGTAELTGEALRFGALAGTMMACPEPAMAVEQSFHATMRTIDRFDINESGELVLIAGDVPLVTAVRSQ